MFDQASLGCSSDLISFWRFIDASESSIPDKFIALQKENAVTAPATCFIEFRPYFLYPLSSI